MRRLPGSCRQFLRRGDGDGDGDGGGDGGGGDISGNCFQVAEDRRHYRDCEGPRYDRATENNGGGGGGGEGEGEGGGGGGGGMVVGK